MVLILAKILSSFVLLLSNIRRLFIGIDSSGFKSTIASQNFIQIKPKYQRSMSCYQLVQMLISIIWYLKIRRAPTRHDNIDFQPLVIRTSEVLPISVTVVDKGYDSEDNHVLIREHLHAFFIIPARYEHVPIFRTHGKYRKQMKRGYPKILYHQRNKDETMISVIKRLFGEQLHQG